MLLQRRKPCVATPARAWQVNRYVLGDTAMLEQDYPVGQGDGFCHFMCDQNRGESAGKPHGFQQRLHFNSRERIERAQWFIEQEQAGMVDQGAGEGHTLLLPA